MANTKNKLLLTMILSTGMLFLLTGCGNTKKLKLYDGTKIEVENSESNKNVYTTRQFHFFEEPNRNLDFLEVVKVEYQNENGNSYYLNYPTYLNGCEFKDLRYDCIYVSNVNDVENIEKDKNAYVDFLFHQNLIEEEKVNYVSEKYTNVFYAHTSFISDNAKNTKVSSNIVFKNIDKNVIFEGYEFKNLSIKTFVDKFGKPYYAFATYDKEMDVFDFTYVFSDKTYTMYIKSSDGTNINEIIVENYK